MDKFRAFAIRNPKVIGLIFAVIIGYTGYIAYDSGRLAALLRTDSARAASEALGG